MTEHAIRTTQAAATKKQAHLADGREILYFDESDDAIHADDKRSLDSASTSSVMRRDNLLGEWVTIASHRQGRTHLPVEAECPLCPSTPDHQTEIPSADYDVVVFENRFPAFSTSASTDGDIPSEESGERLFEHRAGVGRCEVICFTSQHNLAFSQLPPSRVQTILSAWIDRSVTLTALPNVEQVFCFENRGEEIGVTLHHPHGQIYAFPFVTPRTEQMVTQALRYAGGNLFDDLVAAELRAATRIVTRNEHWVAFVPEAARWPYEVRIFPAVRVPDLPALGEAARAAFGPLYLDVLRRFNGLFGRPAPYIAAWHQAPVRDSAARRAFGAHLQVLSVRRAAGKLKYLAGTESGMGVWINDIVPEQAAQRLREAVT
jgi:UDPglucose--hexose-1-phosphate uridylyltransferase